MTNKAASQSRELYFSSILQSKNLGRYSAAMLAPDHEIKKKDTDQSTLVDLNVELKNENEALKQRLQSQNIVLDKFLANKLNQIKAHNTCSKSNSNSFVSQVA